MGNTASIPLRVRRRRMRENSAADLLYTKPSGLYPNCDWEVKTVRRLILRGELAPRYPGRDDPCAEAREECPICMLIYPVLNETCCCAARICTECYLQIRPARHNKEPCPFCKYKRVEAVFKGPREKAEMDREEMEERRALEAIQRAYVGEGGGEEEEEEGGCGCQMADRATCGEDHRARYYHGDKAPVIEPLLLEAMASEVTFSSVASCACKSGAERACGSSSGREAVTSESEAGSSAYLSEGGGSKAVGWYGMDKGGSSSVGEDMMYSEDEVWMKEGIRRSLFDM